VPVLEWELYPGLGSLLPTVDSFKMCFNMGNFVI